MCQVENDWRVDTETETETGGACSKPKGETVAWEAQIGYWPRKQLMIWSIMPEQKR